MPTAEEDRKLEYKRCPDEVVQFVDEIIDECYGGEEGYFADRPMVHGFRSQPGVPWKNGDALEYAKLVRISKDMEPFIDPELFFDTPEGLIPPAFRLVINLDEWGGICEETQAAVIDLALGRVAYKTDIQVSSIVAARRGDDLPIIKELKAKIAQGSLDLSAGDADDAPGLTGDGEPPVELEPVGKSDE